MDDVSNFDAAKNIIDTAVNGFGKIDILINIAGILRDRMLFNMEESEWDAVVAVHMKGTFNTTRHASNFWREQKNPEGHYRLINFTSGSGIYGAPTQPNYAAAKMGIVGFTYSCANALERYGVTSNIIAPAANTRMGESKPDAKKAAKPQDPVRTAENMVPAIAYIASAKSDWLNGRIIGSQGYRVALYSNPDVQRELVSNAPWEIDQLGDLMEKNFKPLVQGENPMFPKAKAPAPAAPAPVPAAV
jgi:NAD(P)-dependent dehydrogenase (short-subunit alcohol dehydrogenase family)